MAVLFELDVERAGATYQGSDPSQERVVRPTVGKQPGLPQGHATKPPRAADTPNFAKRKIKRLVAELTHPIGPEHPPIRSKSFLLATPECLLLLLGG